MDVERHRLAGEVFDAALELPDDQRAAFLRRSCGADTELRREVERWIEQDRRSAGILDRSPLQAITAGDALLDEQLEVGARIGSYRLSGLLGQGGMGVVFLATRDDDDFQRRVAIKVVRGRGMAARDIWRFHRERQILAGLEHPNIARLYDGGSTDDGQPYLVMEYVDGLPITTYCDRHRLPLKQRLGLLIKVCAAVQYAHRNLVVHRDLKPSNILVDTDGEPKLLDFGIAKLLESPATDAGLEATEEHQRILTLSHASPEQILGQPITTASDVYCLGLVLYELLCGVSPFAGSSTPYDVLRRVDEEDLAKPSRRVTARRSEPEADSDGLSPRDIASSRGASPEGLRRSLQGDLDTITAKALRKKSELRYATANELAEDLTRYLQDRPIVAGPPGVGYRLRKFLRRHRAPALVGGLSGLLMILLISVFISTLIAQVDRTEREKKKAEQLVAFLIETFSVSDPNASVGQAVTARELLDSGAQRIAHGLQGDPEVQGMMLDAMGQIYSQIGLLEPAQDLLRRGLELRLARRETTPAEVVESLTHLGAVKAAAGQVEEAETMLQRAVDLGRNLDDLPTYVRALESLAMLEQRLYRFEASRDLYRQALDLRQRQLGADVPGLAQVQRNYGVLLQEEGQWDASRQMLRHSLAARRQHYGDRHPKVAESRGDLARLEHLLGHYAVAESLYRQVVQLKLEIHGANHWSVADSKNSLALTISHQGRKEEAVVLQRQAIEIVRGLSQQDLEVATMASNLAVLLSELRRFEEAEALFLESLDIRRQALGERHPLVGQTYLTLGQLYRRQGQLARAQGLFELAASIAQNLPAGHRAIAYPSLALADLLLERQRGGEAEIILRQALEELHRSHIDGHWRIAMALADLGRSLKMQGRLDEAEQHLLQALEFLRVAPSDNPSRQRQVLAWLVELYGAMERPEQVRLYEEQLQN